MLCPRCNSAQVFTVDSRPYGDTTRRRKECRDCNVRFNTLEVVEVEYKALKTQSTILQNMMKREA